MDKLRTFTRFVMYLTGLWLGVFFMIEIGIPSYQEHAERKQAEREQMNRPRPAPVAPSGPDLPDAHNYDVVPDTRSWFFYIDLTTDGSVWIDSKEYSEREFLSEFEKLSRKFDQVKVQIMISHDTDKSVLRRLKSHLSQKGFDFEVEKTRELEIFSGYEETPQTIETYKETLRLEFYVTEYDRLKWEDRTYTLEEFRDYLDGQAKNHKLLITLILPPGDDFKFLNQVTDMLAARGYDYRL